MIGRPPWPVLSLRLRTSLVAAVVSAVGVAVLATAGLSEIERLLVDDRIDSVELDLDEWLSSPVIVADADESLIGDYGLDMVAERIARPPAPGSAHELLLEELGRTAGDPITAFIDVETAALLDGGAVTIVPLDSVTGPFVDLAVLYHIVDPIPMVRSENLTREDLELSRIPFRGEELVAGAFVGDIRDLVGTMSRWAALWAPAAVAFAFAITWLFTGLALRPVGAMTGRVAAITPDAARRGERVPVPGSRDELSALAERFNQLIDQIVEGDLRQRRFTADAGHELRSPLAVIRSETEQALTPGSSLGREELAETVLAETLRLQGLVEDLLELARGDETAPLDRRIPVDVDDLILNEVRRQRRLAIDISRLGAGRTVGDPDLLARAFRHVIDNAVRHADGTVAVSVGTEQDRVVVRVDDDGTGVAEADRGRIFDRFVRLDEGRSRDTGGSGLGLAVTAGIVRAHGGEVTVEDAPLGGARFVIRLPSSETLAS